MKKNYLKTIFQTNLTMVFLALVGLINQVNFAQQQHINWTGAVNNDWNEAGNWNVGGVTVVAPVTNSSLKITLSAPNTDMAVGDLVEGYGITNGSRITEIAADQKVITLDQATHAAVTIGTTIRITFATPKTAVSAPTLSDIAVINNGGNPTLPSGFITVAGLIVGNGTGAVTGSTLTIPSGTELIVQSSILEPVNVRGGNIVNNGTLSITNSSLTGTAALNGAYGLVFSLPTQLPTTPTTFTYSGTGKLKIDTTSGTHFGGGIYFNGFHASGDNTTYRMLFDGTTDFSLSDKTTGTGLTANTQLIRVQTNGGFKACKVVLGGAGFDFGDPVTGSANGLISLSGAGADVTIEQGTTINVYTNTAMGTTGFQMYVFGNTTQQQAPQKLVNKGTIRFKGISRRPILALYSEVGTSNVQFENQGTFDVDVEITTAGNAAILATNFNAAGTTSVINFINSGTLNLKQPLSGPNAGTPIIVPVGANMPFVTFTNTGTININSAAYATGGRAFNPDKPTDQGSKFINSGTINTNVELRTFQTTNTATGHISFVGNNAHPTKLVTFTLPSSTPAAAFGTKYKDVLGNTYTVAVTKLSATSGATSLAMNADTNIVNPTTTTDLTDPLNPIKPTLTKIAGSGSGDDSIVFSSWTTINDNALFQPAFNSGKISTNSGTRLMTGINGFTTPDATSILSVGGDNANGIAFIDNPKDNLLKLRGMLKISATGNAVAGVDYDQFQIRGALGYIDISEATLDVTGLYTPSTGTTIDIITTNTTVGSEGGINGSSFANVAGLPQGWSVNYTGTIGGKVQLVYSTLSKDSFETFKFNVSPNPTAGIVTISAAENINNVIIFNTSGQKVKSFEIGSKQKQLDITSLPKGIYVMQATIDNAKKAFKIVKQ